MRGKAEKTPGNFTTEFIEITTQDSVPGIAPIGGDLRFGTLITALRRKEYAKQYPPGTVFVRPTEDQVIEGMRKVGYRRINKATYNETENNEILPRHIDRFIGAFVLACGFGENSEIDNLLAYVASYHFLLRRVGFEITRRTILEPNRVQLVQTIELYNRIVGQDPHSPH